MRFQIVRAGVVGIAIGCMVGSVHAGPYADDMAKCLVKSTTEADRATLVKFIFAAVAQNPHVESLAKVSAEQLDEITRNTASLYERLLTESCRVETQQAQKYEGPVVVVQAFQLLGQASMVELMGAPRVRDAMKGLSKYVDEKKIKNLFSPD